MPMKAKKINAERHRLWRFPVFGWIGLAIILFAEALLIADVTFVRIFFTPIVWTGYILFVDGLLHRYTGRSYLIYRWPSFLWMLPSSLFCWLIFEAYNLHLKNWQYINLPDNMAVRLFGYVWSFSTIFPAVLITSDLIYHSKLFDRFQIRRFEISQRTLMFWIFVGALFLVIPIALPTIYARYLFALVWVGFIFLLDPINAFLQEHSLFIDLRAGKIDRLLSLFLSGAICGFFWEFWNYWALTKWVYILPFLQHPKIFEMPAIGFLGFLPFAAECYVMWTFIRYAMRNVFHLNLENA